MAFKELILEKIGSLRFFKIVEPDENGVFVRLGKIKRVLDPGFYWQIPVLDKIDTIIITEQVINIPSQPVMTRDGITLAISGVIKYEVIEPEKTLFAVQNYDRSLINTALGVITSYISRIDRNECKYDTICAEILDELQNEGENWGILVLDFQLNVFTQHTVVSLLTELNNKVLI